MNGPVGATLASKPSKRGGRRRGTGIPNGQARDTSTASAACASAWACCPVSILPCAELYEGVRAARSVATGGQPPRMQGKRASSRGRSLQTKFDLLPFPRGILNNSNYCFMNSVMQALAFVPSFAQLAVCAAEDPNAAPQLPVLASIGKWLLEYWKPAPATQCVRPPRFLFSMPSSRATASAGPAASRGLDGALQEDAQEFLQRLLEEVHQELTAYEAALRDAVEEHAAVSDDDQWRDGTDKKGWFTVKGNETVRVRAHVDTDGRSQLIDSIFGGTLESRLQGKQKQKNRASSVLERYYTLPVDIGFSTECTIEEALTRTFSAEKIYDEKRDKNLKKTLFLDTLPQVLVLHLRRWALTAEGELVKLDNRVTFHTTLTLPIGICSDSKCPAGNRRYALVSVVAHRGGGTRQGHYVTFLAQNVALPSGKQAVAHTHAQQPRTPPSASSVVLCNDTKVSVESYQSMMNETVYFLVYQKQ